MTPPAADKVSCEPAELLLLGKITGFDLPRPWFDVFLLGRLSVQRELEEAQAELRRLDAIGAAPPPFDTRALESLSAYTLAVRRGDPGLVVRALRQQRRNATFGREVA